MSIEQILSDQLARATSDVHGFPDLEKAVQQGRRNRRHRRAVRAAAAVVVVGVAAVGIRAVTGDDDTTVARDPLIAPATDFVAGTDIDSNMAGVIAEHLSSLPPPDDVYPSDSRTAGPIPDRDFARAEDWQATYTLGSSDDFLVIMSAPSEGGVQCQGCAKQKVQGGTLYHQTFTSGDPDHWYFGVYFVRPDGSSVNAFESLTAPDEQTGSAMRQLSDSDVAQLVQDPRLSFTGP